METEPTVAVRGRRLGDSQTQILANIEMEILSILYHIMPEAAKKEQDGEILLIYELKKIDNGDKKVTRRGGNICTLLVHI